MEAATEAEAVERVREQGLILLKIQTAARCSDRIAPEKKSGTFGRLFARARSHATRSSASPAIWPT